MLNEFTTQRKIDALAGIPKGESDCTPQELEQKKIILSDKDFLFASLLNDLKNAIMKKW